MPMHLKVLLTTLPSILPSFQIPRSEEMSSLGCGRAALEVILQSPLLSLVEEGTMTTSV